MLKKWKRFIHCLSCREFFGCWRKFHPTSEIAYRRGTSITTGLLCFSDPIICSNPLQEFNKRPHLK